MSVRGKPEEKDWFGEYIKAHFDATKANLESLKTGQFEMSKEIARMHGENQKQIGELVQSLNDHASLDLINFGKVFGALDPLKKLGFGLVALILVAVIGALVSLVIKK